VKYRQVKLVSGKTVTMTWIENDRRLKPCVRIRLKGNATWWEVREAYTILLDFPPETKWRVGGLL
jgi:hypothetical protein